MPTGLASFTSVSRWLRRRSATSGLVECSGVVERGVRACDGELIRDDPGAGDAEYAPKVLLCPDRAVVARRGAGDGDGLVPEPAPAVTGRDPVDGVLQDAGRRAVVLRRDEEESVRLVDPASELVDGGRGLDALLVEILVVVGHEAEPVEELDLDPGGRQLGGRPGEGRVVRPSPEAAGECEDLHLTRP